MGEVLGQQVVVENVGGAGGMTGSKRVAKAAPDGYNFVHRHRRHPRPGPDPLQEAALQLADRFHPGRADRRGADRADRAQGSAGRSNFKEFVAYAKANQAQDAVRLGRRRLGHPSRLRAAQLRRSASNITHVPYRGTGPAMQDLQGGRIDYLCEVVTTAKPQIDGGTVKGIAISTPERSPALPNLPTAHEQGTTNSRPIPGTRSSCPRARPSRSSRNSTSRAGGDAHAGGAERLAELGAEIVSDDRATPEYLGQFVKGEIEKWATPIKASGVHVD